MEFFNKIKDFGKKGMNSIINKAKKAVLSFLTFIVMKLMPLCIIALLVYPAVEWVLELIRGENNPQTVYSVMDVEDFSDLVEIKGNENTGYYFAFKQGADEKLKKAAEELDHTVNNSTIEVDDLKKMIQAELVSSYPNLGGSIGQKDDTTETYNYNNLNDMLIIGDDIVAQIQEKNLAPGSKVYGVKGSKPYDWRNKDAIVNGKKTIEGLPEDSNNIKAIIVMLGINDPSDYESMLYDHGVLAEISSRYPEKKIFLQKIITPENADEDTKFAIENFNTQMKEYEDERDYIKFIDATNGVKITDINSIPESQLNKLIQNMTSEIKKIKFPREKEEFEDDGTGFQGAIKIRRVSPDKNIGDMNKNIGAVFTSYGEYTTSSGSGSNASNGAKKGTAQEISENIKSRMNLKTEAGLDYSDLRYLTIPYIGFDRQEHQGEMIVAADLAEDVLDIFAELYDIGYPIQKMELVDKYGYSDYETIEANNTSAYNCRQADNSSDWSNHAFGRAIDINPQINPCIINGSNTHRNADTYANRSDRSSWDENAQKAYIGTDSKIYEIFKNHGWTWGGETFGSNYLDYQHFEKEESSTTTTTNDETQQTDASNAYTKVIVLDPGHGASMSRWTADNYLANGFIKNGSQWGEYRHWKSGTCDEECNGSGCNGNNDVPGAGEWYSALSGERDVEPDINLANALAAKKYLEEMGYTVRMTRTDNSTHPSFAQRSKYCFPNNDTNQKPDAELYVCIHSNAGGGNGSAYISLADGHYDQKYIGSDFVSESNNAGKAINDRIVKDTSLDTYSEGVIDFEPDLIAFHKNTCPTAYLEIGFYDNSSDLSILNSESDKIGKAIADGIDDYFEHPQGMISGSAVSGTGTQKVNTYSGIKSKVNDLSYVPETTEELTYVTKEVFDGYIKSDVEDERLKALDHFTLDENMRLIVASWSYNKNGDPQITVKKSSPINYKTAMSKYFMPFEYLTSFLVDTLDPDFVMDLAELALDSEFIIAVQDNVTTRQTTTIDYTRETTDDKWEQKSYNAGPITESCSVSVELTYADAWFVRAEKESNFSTLSLKSSSGDGKILTGEKGDFIGNFKITTYCEACNTPPYSLETESGKEAKVNHTIAVSPELYNDQDSPLHKDMNVIINGQIYTVEDTGELQNNCIDIFVPTGEDGNCICRESSINDSSGSTEVFVAKNVNEEKAEYITAEESKSLIKNAITVAKGKVEVKETTTTTTSEGDLAKTESTTSSVAVKYENGGSKITGKEESFASILDKSKDGKENLKPDWLFQVLSTNERTANMVDLTKYLIYKATGDSYGITEFNFSEFDLNKFSNAGGVYGRTIQEKVWFAILKEGYSKEAAAGVLGNIEAESGFNAGVIESGTGIGAGLCQWSYGRRNQLEEYAASKGVDWTDENTQIEFLIGEITPGGGANGYANYQLVTYKGYSPSDWSNALTPEDAATAFCWCFERPGVPRMDVRTDAATRYYEQFKDMEMPSGGDILTVCEQVMNDEIQRVVHYSLANLTWGNIDKAADHPYACCATYVSIVLYKSGLLTADQINAFNYNYTGTGGLPDMLEAAGWRRVSHSEIQPGDVINDRDKHALIYAGGDLVYDQNCGVISSEGRRTNWRTIFCLE